MVWQALGAVGSLLAVVVAVGIAVVDYKTHGAELIREREHRLERERVESARLHREQAERVSQYRTGELVERTPLILPSLDDIVANASWDVSAGLG